MTLSAMLEDAGARPDSVESRAQVILEKLDRGFTVTGVRLEVLARGPGPAGLPQESFARLTEEAKRTCPVSRLLNTTITLERVMINRA